GKAKLAGVVGWPVAHSLSPRLHGHWLSAHAVDGAYVPLAVRREDFARVVESLRTCGFMGVNVTVPHKEAAFAIAHEVDDAALAAGAVNLLVFDGGRIMGRNTDAGGLAASLTEALGKNALQGKTAVLLGAGGAARAAILALDTLGVSEVRIVGRNLARAEHLARDFSHRVKALLRAFGWLNWPDAAQNAGILVNATSAGMTGKETLDVALDPLPVNAIVTDLVYNPLETELLKAAQARGNRVVDGLGMLMHQAVPAFEAFYGERPQVTPALRSELKKALRHG
ncbi:MAG TPA: shikimate dehydrogenase, partial [Rhizomicrobium sp.]|nr:shikimate dehydrogenase [Rhizomicrobium sp.]